MAKFAMEDDSVVNTEKAKQWWEEETRWNGNNHISVATGSQWHHETLYLSSKGRYYIVSDSNYKGTLPSARFVEDGEAVKWLLANDHEIPEGLATAAAAVEE